MLIYEKQYYTMKIKPSYLKDNSFYCNLSKHEAISLLNMGAIACAKNYYTKENDDKFLKQSLYIFNKGLALDAKDFFCNINVASIYSYLDKEHYAYFYLKKAHQIFKNTKYSNITEENKEFITKVIKKFIFIQEDFMDLESDINKLEQFLAANTTTIKQQLNYIKTQKNIELINNSVELERIFDESSILEKIKNVVNMIDSLKKGVVIYKKEDIGIYQSEGCCCIIQKVSIKYDNPLLNNVNLFNQLAKKIGIEKLLNLTDSIVETDNADVLQNAIEDGYDSIYNLLIAGDTELYQQF